MALRWLPPDIDVPEALRREGVVRGIGALWLAAATGLGLAALTVKPETSFAPRAAGYLQAVILASWIGLTYMAGQAQQTLDRAGWWGLLGRAGRYGLGAAGLAFLAERAMHGATVYGVAAFVLFPVLGVAALWILLAFARPRFDAVSDVDP